MSSPYDTTSLYSNGISRLHHMAHLDQMALMNSKQQPVSYDESLNVR